MALLLKNEIRIQFGWRYWWKDLKMDENPYLRFLKNMRIKLI